MIACQKYPLDKGEGREEPTRANSMVAPLDDLLSEGLITEGEYETLLSDSLQHPEEIEARLGVLLGDERGDFDSCSVGTSICSDGRERGPTTEPGEQENNFENDLLERTRKLRASFQHFDAERTLVVQRITAVSNLVNAAHARIPQALTGEASDLAELMMEDSQEQVPKSRARESRVLCMCVYVCVYVCVCTLGMERAPASAGESE